MLLGVGCLVFLLSVENTLGWIPGGLRLCVQLYRETIYQGGVGMRADFLGEAFQFCTEEGTVGVDLG